MTRVAVTIGCTDPDSDTDPVVVALEDDGTSAPERLRDMLAEAGTAALRVYLESDDRATRAPDDTTGLTG